MLGTCSSASHTSAGMPEGPPKPSDEPSPRPLPKHDPHARRNRGGKWPDGSDLGALRNLASDQSIVGVRVVAALVLRTTT